LAAGETARRAAGSGRIERNAAGLPIALSVAGPALANAFVPALLEGTASRSAAALHIDVFDSVSTGIALPAPPWPASDVGPRGLVAGLPPGCTVIVAAAPGTVSVLDRGQCRAVEWVHDVRDTHPGVRAAPFAALFATWLPDHGRQVLHAGAVAGRAGAVLLLGAAGAGKSTAALACARGGMGYVADDFCALDSEHRVHALYTTGKLAADAPVACGDLPRLTQTLEGKAVLQLAACRGIRLVSNAPVVALALLGRASGEATSVSPLRRAEALRRAGPNCAFQLPGSIPATLSALRKLVEGVPCVSLRTGSRPEAIAAAVQALADRA
jgi:hypothetical protein